MYEFQCHSLDTLTPSMRLLTKILVLNEEIKSSLYPAKEMRPTAADAICLFLFTLFKKKF